MCKKNIVLLFFVFIMLETFSQNIVDAKKEASKFIDALIDNKNSLNYPNRIIYIYIKQLSNIKYNHKKILPKEYAPNDADEESMYPFYNRLIDNKVLNIDSVKAYIANHDMFDRALMWAIYADNIEDSDIAEKVNALLLEYTKENANIRGVTHAALLLKWLSDLGELNKIPNNTSLKEIYINQSIQYLEKNKSYTDEGMEAILTFILLDRIDLVKQQWIEEIIIHQQKDGGWKWDDTQLVSHQHPTLLALWILSAWENKNKRYNPTWFFK